MKLNHLLAIALTITLSPMLKAQGDARGTLEWLRVLAIDARITYELAEGDAEPDLFFATSDDGRTLIAFIADTLGAGGGANWPLIDEGVTACLAEGERLKRAADAAPDPSPGRTALNEARKQFLHAAALLLDAYKGASQGVFDEHAVGLDSIPDWALPGEIQIREAAGSARINVRTKEFGGRISGELGLPKFDAEFAVPNASFDSRGNIDLTAYGMASFPPDSPDSVMLSVPKRRPLILHLSEDGDFRIAGSGRVRLPDGNQFEAHFDADHPMYEFGLAYAGNLTLEMAKEVTLLRPTIDPATVFEPDAILGLGQFFGSLGKGYETFMEDSPELPSLDDLNIGVAPEFTTPEVVVPFDVFDAWGVALVNDEVRPLVNGSFDTSVQFARKQIQTMRQSVRSAQSELAPTLEQIRRMRTQLEELAKARKVLEDADAAAALDDDAVVALADLIAATEQAADIAADYLDNTPSDAEFKTGFAAVKLWLNAVATAQGTGSEAGINTSIVFPKIDQWTNTAFGRFGYDKDGDVVDMAKADALSPVDLRVLAWASLELETNRQALGEDVGALTYQRFFQREFEATNALYEKAITDGDIEARAQYAARLHQLWVIAAQTDFTDDVDDIGTMFSARDDTIEAIAAAGGDTPEQLGLARKIFIAGLHLNEAQDDAAGRRVDEMLGERVGTRKREKRDLATRAELGSGNHGFLSQWYFAVKAFSDAGVISLAQRTDYEASLAGLMRYFADTQVEAFSDVTQIEQNLEAAFDALLIMLDALAIADDMLPDDTELLGALQADWEALHVPFLGVAEAQRAHFYLSAYAVEIANATERYGDGMATALKDAAKVAGSEALRGLGTVVDYLAGVVDGFSLEEFGFAMPGDMQVQRAFGVLKFDVSEEPPTWDFEFGGQLYFADYDLTFAVPSAHIFSDGMFDVSLMTEGPVPFGFEETMRLSTAFAMSGNVLTPSINALSADGTLTYTPEDGGTPEEFMGTLAYEFDDGHSFEFTASFDGARQLFTEEVALFSGGFGFALQLDETGAPQQGEASADIGLGFLLREDADVTTLDAGDYWLNFVGSAEVNFSVTDRTADFRLLSGTLTLPPDIFSAPVVPPATSGAPATIMLESVVCVRVDFENQTISWCDEANQTVLLSANNIHAAIPGLEGSDLEITTGKLRLSGNEFPVIEQLDASLTLPLPSGDEATVNIDVAHWPIDGLPESVEITLEEPLTLLDLDGIAIRVKAAEGVEYGGCPAGISFAHDAATGMTTLQIASAMAVDIDPDMLWDAGENASIGTEVSGCFAWEIGELPTFVLDDVTISGRFRIGGANGVELLGARGATAAEITFANINNIFQRPPADPADSFRVDLEGAVNFDDIIQFELLGSSFIWDGSIAASDLLPRFEPGGACFVAGEEGIELVASLLPLYPTELCLRFNDGSLPLFPAAGETGLFDPLNIQVLASGVITLPNGAAVEGGSPGISGAVTNVEIQFQEIGGFPVPDFVRTMASIDSLTLQIENLDIPPLGGLTGGLHLGNLNAVAEGNYDELFFAGNLGGKINNIGASVLLAARPTEFVGACFEVSGGPAGIPLGPTGILITGASGGINFKNSFSNPCDFSSYITIGGDGIPTGADFPAEGERGGSPPDIEELNTAIGDDLAADPVNTEPDIPPAPDCVLPTSPDFNCIQGPFPPPSLNPLCEIIQVGGEDRVIFKGSHLLDVDAVLAAADISRSQLDAASPADAIDLFVDAVIAEISAARDQVLTGDFDLNPATPPTFNPDTVDARALEFFTLKLDDLVNSVGDAARNALREGFSKALMADPEASLYDILVQKAAEGVPCFDVTLRLEGTVSHAAVSSVLSGTGAITVSSTGTAVVEGQINLIGIPVGDATLALSITTPEGDIDPAFGGVAEVALGPLELGRMTLALDCQGCYGAVTNAMQEWLSLNAVSFGGDVEEFMIAMMDSSVPRLAPRDRAEGVDAHFMDLTEEEKMAWLASFYNVFQVGVDNARKIALGQTPDPLPVVVTPAALQTFLGSFTELITRILVDVNPRVCFGGDIGPKIFGFPLTGGGSSFGGGMLYQRVTDISDPQNPVDYQELVAQMQFSPAQTLSSVLLGASAYALPTAIDQAQMGYSLRMPAFTEENVALMLTDPSQFAGNQLETLIEDSVFSFGYQLQPLGYKLADGQGRVIMPRIGGHPSRGTGRYMRDPDDPSNTLPLGAWTNPDDLNDPLIPTRMEVILAALSKGQLQNPLWRGSSQDLQSLFALPSSPCYQPSNGGCDLLTAQVAARVDPAAFAGMDLPNHFFPDGGFIGGAEVALPNVIARPAPLDRLNQLFTVPNADSFQAWSANAGILFGDPGDTENENFDDPGYAYFTGTTCSGQMAMYMPFPGPPTGFDFDNASLEDFVNTISSLDMSGLADRTLPSFPHERILLSGWLDAPVMGMPVAQGSVDYNPARQCFSLMAEIPETWDHDDNPATAEIDSWLAKFVTGEVEIEIKGADYMVDPAAPPTGGMIERLATIGQSLDPANAAAIISDIQATMPKASMLATAGVQIPTELEPFLGVSADTSLSFFAFSPEFEPGFEPANSTPFAVAKRRGGYGLTGTFDLFVPTGGAPISVDGLEGSFAVNPDADLGLFPAVTGNLMVDTFAIPGLPTLTNAEIAFSSSPDNLDPYTAIEGHLTPFSFVLPLPLPGGGTVDLLALSPLNAGGTIGGRFEVIRDDAGPGGRGTRMSIDPASANMPFLGQNVALAVYGGIDSRGNFEEFSFSSVAGERWQATVCLHNANDRRISGPDDLTPPTISIRDPFSPVAGTRSLEFTPNTTICGTLCGNGLNSFSLELDLPGGITATFFPGQDTSISKTFAPSEGSKLYVDSAGRFYVDFGDIDGIGLPGALTAGGRFEFGFNPVGENPDVVTAPSALVGVTFPATGLSGTATMPVTVRNVGQAMANVSVGATPGADFTCSDTGFALEPDELRVVDVVFHPSSAGLRTGSLQVVSDDPSEPLIVVPLTGTGISGPVYFQSRDDLAFGDTVTGGVVSGSVTVGNFGSAAMQITSVTKTGSGASLFSVSPAGSISLAPGESQLYQVEFAPTAQVASAATLTFNTATQGSHEVGLSGNGTDRRWITVLDEKTAGSDAALNKVLMLDTQHGYVVGDDGTFLETRSGGHAWTPREVSGFDLTNIYAQPQITAAVKAEYHFEDPYLPESFRDSGPEGLHIDRSLSNPPASNAYSTGRFGGGLGFFSTLAFGNTNTGGWHLKLPNFDLNNSWAIAFWADPIKDNNGQCFISKATSGSADQFVFGFYGGRHRLLLGGQTHDFGTKQTGWQHFVIQGSYSSSTNTTSAWIYRNNALIGSRNFTGNVAEFSGGRSWLLGADYDGANLSDWLYGNLDEVYFFNSTLSSAQRAQLADGNGGQRIVVVGENGTVLQTETRGAGWHMPFDQNPNGWRQGIGVYSDFDWLGATVESSGRILLGGSHQTIPFANRYRAVFREDHFGGGEFDYVTFNSAAGNGINEIVQDIVTLGDGNSYAASGLGRLFKAGAQWSQHGGLDLTESFYALEPIGFNDYLAVGEDGVVVRSVNGGNPVQITQDDSTAHLRDAAWNGVADIHVVGDGGVHLYSSNTGGLWVPKAEGLVGNNRGIDVVRSASQDHAWVVGEQHRIQYRPPSSAARPYITFNPGELDFGYVPVGQSRTLPLSIRNRGSEDLVIGSLGVEGSGYSLVQGGVSRLAPGDGVTLQVRYKPADASNFDAGNLHISTNDGSTPFLVPLNGSAGGNDWTPVLLGIGGNPVNGEVRDMVFTHVGVSASDGYLIVETAGASHFFRSTNNGQTWTRIVINAGIGRFYKFHGVDAVKTGGSDTVVLAGELHDSRAGLVDGVVLVSTNSGSSWTARTPNDGVAAPFTDISIYPDDDADNVIVACSSTRSGDGDVWQTSDHGGRWSRKTQTPAGAYDGGRIELVPVQSTNPPEIGSLVVTSSGSRVYARDWNDQWEYSPFFPFDGVPGIVFNGEQPITDMVFGVDPSPLELKYGFVVGDKGLFWRWEKEPTTTTPFQSEAHWVPASNAEVFGTTDLKAIYFNEDRGSGLVAGGSKIFTSGNHGHSWSLEFDAGPGAQMNAVASYWIGIKRWAAGSLDGKAVVYRYRATPETMRPLLSANDVEIVGTTSPGGSLSKAVTIENIGDAPLDLHDFRLESDDPISRFRIVGGDSATDLDAGDSRNISIEFAATPEPIDVGALDPTVFFRFEQGWDDDEYPDHSKNGAVATPSTTAGREPRTFQDAENGKRDRCLKFDGGDYAEFDGPDTLDGDYSFACWVNVEDPTRNQAFFGKHSTTGGNFIIGGIYNDKYTFRIRGVDDQEVLAEAGWQHIAVTCERSGNATIVRFFKDGEQIWDSATQGVTFPVAGNVTGKPWALGAEWDGTSNIGDYLRGCLDDFAMFDRVLTSGEIQALANKSPLCGEHRATLVINSGSENGRRTIDLRATVGETTELAIIDTVPSGIEIMVDDEPHTTPVAFAVRDTAGEEFEWAIGSQHEVTVPRDANVVAAGGTTISYEFGNWNHAATRTITVTADTSLGRLVANYTPTVDLAPPATSVGGGGLPVSGDCDTGFDITAALSGTPAGPFVRMTDGAVSLPGLAADGFEIGGELMVGIGRFTGSVVTSDLAFPPAGSRKFVEIEPSSWSIDFNAPRRKVLIQSESPQIKLLGKETLPAGDVCIEVDVASAAYEAKFLMGEDFKPMPGMLEFKAGGVSVAHLGGGSFNLSMDGGLRLLDLTGIPGVDDWAFDEQFVFTTSTPSFDVALNTLLGSIPPELFDNALFKVDWGDIRVQRNPVWGLQMNNLGLDVLGQGVTTVSGSAGLDGKLLLEGTLGAADNVRLVSNNLFSLRTSGGDEPFRLEIDAAEGSLVLDLPDLMLHSSAAGFVDNAITVPGFRFDSSAAFDTGQLALPTGHSFDGIAIVAPDEGKLADNHVRLARDSDGAITFNIAAELPFLPACALHDFGITIANSGTGGATEISGSYGGNFCVLPEEKSFGFSAGTDFQFSGSAFGFTVFFGQDGAGYRNDATGLCIGDRP